MISTLKAEARKLLTVRSTYVVVGLALLLTLVMAFYFEGVKGSTGSPASELLPTALAELIRNTSGAVATFLPIVAILFVTHEYRYNTITYTLTANNRRLKVLLAKTLVMLGFGLVAGAIIIGAAVGSYFLGLSLRDAVLPAQVDVLDLLLRAGYYILAYVLVGMILGFILRSIVGAIAVLLLGSTVVEPLLGIPLKDNAMYLPFSSLDNVMFAGQGFTSGTLSVGTALAVSGGYIAVSLLVAAFLFLRRDAS